jgi:predicted enzyme related to lactoylglutathione lyase
MTIAGRNRLYRPARVWEKKGRKEKAMLKRLKFVTVPVHDQARALEFYTTKLGLKVFTDQKMGNDRWIELQVPGGETMLVLFRQSDFQPGKTPAAVFVADNVKSTYEELKSRGVEFTEEPTEMPYGIDSAFRDPSGNNFRLTQVREMAAV